LAIYLAILQGALAAVRLALIARIILEWARMIFPKWQPTGVVLALLAVPYMLTDWAVKPLRKLIKPIKIGASAFDLAIIVLWVVIIIIQWLLTRVS